MLACSCSPRCSPHGATRVHPACRRALAQGRPASRSRSRSRPSTSARSRDPGRAAARRRVRRGRRARDRLIVAVTAAVAGAALWASGMLGPLGHGIYEQLWHLDHTAPAFLHGEVSVDGWWHYYAVVLALKLPLGTLAAIAIAAARPRTGSPLERDAIAALVVPAAVVIAFLSWSRLDLGVRLVLPALPLLLYVFAGRAATLPGRWRHAVVVAVAVAAASSFASLRRRAPRTATSSRVRPAAPTRGCRSRTSTGGRTSTASPATCATPARRRSTSPTTAAARPRAPRPAPRHAVDHAVRDHGRRRRRRPASRTRRATRRASSSRSARRGARACTRATPACSRGSTTARRSRRARPELRVYDVTDDADAHAWLAIVQGVTTPGGACERQRAIELDPGQAARLATTR